MIPTVVVPSATRTRTATSIRTLDDAAAIQAMVGHTLRLSTTTSPRGRVTVIRVTLRNHSSRIVRFRNVVVSLRFPIGAPRRADQVVVATGRLHLAPHSSYTFTGRRLFAASDPAGRYVAYLAWRTLDLKLRYQSPSIHFSFARAPLTKLPIDSPVKKTKTPGKLAKRPSHKAPVLSNPGFHPTLAEGSPQVVYGPGTVAVGAEVGSPLILSAAISTKGGIYRYVNLYFEIRDGHNTRVGRSSLLYQTLTRAPHVFTMYIPVSTPGTYTLKIGVFTSNWKHLIKWDNGAVTFDVH